MLIVNKKIDSLEVCVFQTREAMGKQAADDVAKAIKEVIKEKGNARMIFAAAPSQSDMLKQLRQDESVDWSKVEAFHMDEYIGLAADAPQGFGNFLKRHLFDHVPLKEVHLLNTRGANLEEEITEYENKLKDAPIDIVCLGVGENGHIAFNDPPVADFRDKAFVKVVDLEERCRIQQVNDKCFNQLEEVPTRALTLTIPALMAGKRLFCVVPGVNKRGAIEGMLTGKINEQCPASILRTHKQCKLYLDKDAYYEA